MEEERAKIVADLINADTKWYVVIITFILGIFINITFWPLRLVWSII